MADLLRITIPSNISTILAHSGKIITVSFGTNRSRVSPLENSPPIPAVVSINPTAAIPIPACLESTVAPNFLRTRTPTARPAEVIESSILLANKGLSIPSPGDALIPLIIANGVANHPPSIDQWDTASRASGHIFIMQSKKATPERANMPTVNSVAIT